MPTPLTNPPAQAPSAVTSPYLIQERYRPDGTIEVLSVQKADTYVLKGDETILRDFPESVAEETSASPWFYRERLVNPTLLTPAHWDAFNRETAIPELWPDAEVRTLVSQGPVANRVNLTIVGDGYTLAEKERFFEDAQRITREMFVGQAFASYLPLFNVHAVFVPSKDSGITDTVNKDTALGLYRSPQGSKRAIMPGDPAAARRALRLAPRTDYSVLLANDDYYGGLGGEFAITTRSLASGSMVLHHEFGHNISEVGEEYDGGDVYRGANFSASSNVSWQEWVDSPLKVEKGQSLAMSYPWKNIASEPVRVKFTVPGNPGDNIIIVDLSSVGWASSQDVEVLIDGAPYEIDGIFTADRSFFKLKGAENLPPGKHELVIRDKNRDGDNVVAAVRIAAYPKDYDFTRGKTGAFPTFNSGGRFVGYRPTHDDCLMRDMRVKHFCAADQQSIWHNLLRRVSLIDGLNIFQGDAGTNVSLQTPDLTGLSIAWYLVADGKETELPEYRNMKNFTAPHLNGAELLVRVRFDTEEVRRRTTDFEDSARVALP